MTVSITEFLTARLKEDEQITKAALGETEQPWSIDTEPDLPAKHVQGRPSIKTSGMGWQTTPGDGIWSCDDPDDECRIYRRDDKSDAEHITRFDPKRILADVAAKRAILAEHKPEGYYVYTDDDTPACSTCGDYTIVWPCTTILALADIYRDHPDHPGEWPKQPVPDD